MSGRRRIERVLVRLPNWLGDALMARPLLFALRAMRPALELTAVGPPALLELLASDATWDRAEAWPLREGGLDALRRPSPDAALVLPPSFSSAWFAWRSGARERVGYAHEGRTPLLTHALPRPARGEQHASREYAALGAALGAGDAPVPTLASAPAAREAASALVSDGAGAPFAILGPGAIYGPAKRWPAERFIELGRRLAARGLRTLVCGADGERDVCERVAVEIGPPARSLAGHTSLTVQAALCSEARAVVCNDSGLAHLGGAVGAPTVTVFGSTSSAWTAPLGPRVRVVQRAPACSPCFQRRCRIGTPCLTGVGAEHVARALEPWIGATGAPAGRA